MRPQTIAGATRLVVLLGDPVAHSLSPAIHNHAFASLGLPFVYVPLRVPGAALPQTLSVLRACGFGGANVTVPHKRAVLPCCDKVSELSEKIGAVNTLYFEGALLSGTTTDHEGFFRALSWMEVDPDGREIVILGNGGTARTIAMALGILRNPARITLAGRDIGRVSALAGEVSLVTGLTVGAVSTADAACEKAIGSAALLVNCTSAGMHPNAAVSPVDASVLHKGLAVFDAIYNPSRTQLLADAERAGCRTQNGLRMLLYQALASFRLWTGKEAPESLFDITELELLVGTGR